VGDDEREAWKRGMKWREKGGGVFKGLIARTVGVVCRDPAVQRGVVWPLEVGVETGRPRYATLILIRDNDGGG